MYLIMIQFLLCLCILSDIYKFSVEHVSKIETANWKDYFIIDALCHDKISSVPYGRGEIFEIFQL